jgi:hypothetical protein
MAQPIDHGLSILEEARRTRARSFEHRIATASSLVDGARVETAPERRARKEALAERIVRNVAISLADRRIVNALAPATHARLTIQVARLLTRLGLPATG